MYYNKKEVQDYFSEQLKLIETDQEKYRLIGTPEELARQFLNSEEVLGIFWTTHTEKGDSVDIQMHGKAFVEVDPDLYTDDRFALDSVLAVREGKNVGDIVRERWEKQSVAQDAIENQTPQDLLSIFREQT